MKRYNIQKIEEVTAALHSHNWQFFKEGAECELWRLGETGYLIRLPKIFFLSADTLLQVAMSNNVYVRLTHMQLPFVPDIVDLSGDEKNRLACCPSWVEKACGDDDEAKRIICESIQIFAEAPGKSLIEKMQKIDLSLKEEGEPFFGSWKETAKFYAQLVSNVLVLHQNNIIHGDLNPENILIEGVRLIDFGRSQVILNKGKARAWSSSIIYSPPECLNEDGHLVLATAIDYWALGVLLYYLITGNENVFNFDDAILNCKAKQSEYKKLIDANSKIDFTNAAFATPQGKLAKQIILGLLNINPKKRANFQLKRHRFYRVQQTEQAGTLQYNTTMLITLAVIGISLIAVTATTHWPVLTALLLSGHIKCGYCLGISSFALIGGYGSLSYGTTFFRLRHRSLQNHQISQTIKPNLS